MNSTQVFGTIMKEPEVLDMMNGKYIAKLIVMTEYNYFKGDDKHTSKEYHKVIAFGQHAKNMLSLKSGTKIFITGRLQTKKNGETEIVVDKFEAD